MADTNKNADHGASLEGKNLTQDDLAASRRLRDAYENLKKQLSRVIVGQNEVLARTILSETSGWESYLD